MTMLRSKIYYDGAIYGIYSSRPGGISNFFDRLISLVSEHHHCLLSSSRPSDLPHPSGPNLKIVRASGSLKLGRLQYRYQRAKFSAAAALFRPSILHPTYYTKPAGINMRLPVVYTAYDMIHERWSNQLDPTGRLAAKKKECFELATAIACISESTRSDLLEMYPHLESKVSVIYLAGTARSVVSSVRDGRLECAESPYILYVGARESYKNFARLAVAFSRIQNKASSLRLKVVGAALSSSEIDLLDAVGILRRVDVYADIADQQLHDLYRGAMAFVYPSLYEGFGIPPLEAMVFGAPVLASSASSIPEVVGDAALLFNPLSVDSIADAILRVVSRPELREALRCRGYRRAEFFTWEKTANQYLRLYEKMLAGRAC